MSVEHTPCMCAACCIERGKRHVAEAAVLWCLHILGPDDVHPAPSKAHAEKAAALFNAHFDVIGDMEVSAVVEPWPHSADSHAADVDKFCAEWLAPSLPAADVLTTALGRIASMSPESEPETEDYDDTESAYSNGHDVAAWEAAQVARDALAKAGAL